MAEGSIDNVEASFVDGWVMDADEVEVFVNGEQSGVALCNLRRGDLEELGVTNGKGYRYFFPQPIASGSVIEVRLRNGVPIPGSPKTLTEFAISKEALQAIWVLLGDAISQDPGVLIAMSASADFNANVTCFDRLVKRIGRELFERQQHDLFETLVHIAVLMCGAETLEHLANLHGTLSDQPHALRTIYLALRGQEKKDPRAFELPEAQARGRRYIIANRTSIQSSREQFKGFGSLELPADIRINANVVCDDPEVSELPSMRPFVQKAKLRPIPISYGWCTNCLILPYRFNVLLETGDIVVEDVQFSWRNENYFYPVGTPVRDAVPTPNGRRVIVDLARKRIESAGDHFLLGGVQNFGHWLFDHASRLRLWTELRHQFSADLKFIVRSDRNAWEDLILRHFGIENIVQLGDDSFLQPERCFASSIFCQQNTISPLVTSFLRSQFCVADQYEGTEKRLKLFVSRGPVLASDLRNRRALVNEEEVWDYLKTREFTRVVMEGLSPEEQMSLFRRAKIVVTPTGSALNNLLFSPKDTVGVELKTWNNVNLDFVKVASAIGQQYTVVPCWEKPLDLSLLSRVAGID